MKGLVKQTQCALQGYLPARGCTYCNTFRPSSIYRSASALAALIRVSLSTAAAAERSTVCHCILALNLSSAWRSSLALSVVHKQNRGFFLLLAKLARETLVSVRDPTSLITRLVHRVFGESTVTVTLVRERGGASPGDRSEEGVQGGSTNWFGVCVVGSLREGVERSLW